MALPSTLFMSLGSIAGVVGTYAILIPLTIINRWPIEYLLYAFVGTAMIIYQHRGNIVRLFKGIERKLGERAEKVRTPTLRPTKQKGVIQIQIFTSRDSFTTGFLQRFKTIP